MERSAIADGDADLVERVRNGDAAAFESLYERYVNGIHDFALRMAGNHEDASDITQDTFVRAYRSIGEIANPQAFKSWLFAIARNNALNTITRTRPHGTVPLDVQRAECPGLDIPDPDRMSDPALLTEARATAHLVWEAAAGLSPDEYALLDLHVRRELGGAELAKLLGTSANSMYVRLNRLRASFERSARALFLLRGAGRNCDVLQRELRESPVGRLSPGVVRIAERHRTRCQACTAAVSRLSAPAEVFGALSLVAAGTSFKGILALLGLGAAAAGAGAAASSAGTGAGVASSATATAASSGVGAGMAATAAAHGPLLVSIALAAVGLGGLVVTLTMGNVFDRGGGETASASDDPSPQPAIATSTPPPTEPPAVHTPPSPTATATQIPATTDQPGLAPRPRSSPAAAAPTRPSPAPVRSATPATTPMPTSTPPSASTSTSITSSADSPTPAPTQPAIADEPTVQPDPPQASPTATPTDSPAPSPTATSTALPQPSLSLLVVASAAVLQAPGGQVTLEITVRNSGSTAASLDFLDVGGGGTCTVPRQLEAGETYTCSATIDVIGAAGQVVNGAVVARLNGDGGSASAEAAWEVAITFPGPYVLDVSFAPGLPLGHIVVNIGNAGNDDVLVEEVSASGAGVGNGETTCKGEATGESGGGASSKGRLSLPAGTSASCTIKLKLNPLLLGLWPLTVTVDGATDSGRAAHGLAQLLLGD